MATQTAEGGSATLCETEAGSQVDTREENSTTLKLKLQKKDKTRKKIQWTEDTIDNEGEAGFWIPLALASKQAFISWIG